MNKKENRSSIALVAIIVVVLIAIGLIIYVISLGNISINETNTKIPNEFKETLKRAKARHSKLKELISKQVAAEKRLNKWFKRIYLGVRVFFIVLWVLGIYYGYNYGLISDLEDALNYSEATLLIVFVLNFLCFGSLTNLKNMLESIRFRVENWFFRKYANLPSRIQVNKEELIRIDTELKALGQE